MRCLEGLICIFHTPAYKLEDAQRLEIQNNRLTQLRLMIDTAFGRFAEKSSVLGNVHCNGEKSSMSRGPGMARVILDF
jgi:hypothetical protein